MFLITDEGPIPNASVHPPEITSAEHLHIDFSPATPAAACTQTFRHSGWHHQRIKVYQALLDAQASASRTERFSSCGKQPHVLQSPDPPYDYVLAGDYCRDRFCVPCSKVRGRTITANVLSRLGGKPCRFLTLTLRSTTETLLELLNKLQESFRVLRTKRLWRSKVTGGVAFVEAKWNPDGNRWHVHLHVLTEGLFIDHAVLKADWYAITGDSYVVDLRFCPAANQVTHYVTKYVTKPFDASIIDRPDRLAEAVAAYHRRRLFTTFGTWRGVPLLQADPNTTWINLGLLEELVFLALNGDPEALQICLRLNTGATKTALATIHPRPPPHHAANPEEKKLHQYRLDLEHADASASFSADVPETSSVGLSSTKNLDVTSMCPNTPDDQATDVPR